MKLEEVKLDTNLSIEEVSCDRLLSTQIQQILIDLKLLCGPADGLFGKKSASAFTQFNQIFKLKSALNYYTAQALLLKKLPTPELDLSKGDFASLIAKYMIDQNYLIETGVGQTNIIYVEGVGSNGWVNDDAANEWNDLRLILKIDNNIPNETN